MINWTRVEELQEEVGEDEFPEVLEIFLEEFEEALAALDNKPPTAPDMHFLKGSAVTLGFEDTGQLCAKAEKQVAQYDDTAPLITSIRNIYLSERAELLDNI